MTNTLVKIRVGNFGQIIGSGPIKEMEKELKKLQKEHPNQLYVLEGISEEAHKVYMDDCDNWEENRDER